MTYDEAWKHIHKILMKTKEHNDVFTKESSELHIVLLNLKILDAHIEYELKKQTGIVPVADHLERTINRFKIATADVTKDRDKSLEAIDVLNKYFKDINNVGGKND